MPTREMRLGCNDRPVDIVAAAACDATHDLVGASRAEDAMVWSVRTVCPSMIAG